MQHKSSTYENDVINYINKINKYLEESVKKFNNEVKLLFNIEDIKHNINNLHEIYLNYLGIINSLDKFSVSEHTQDKIIKMQEKTHDFLNKLRDILYTINTIELDNIKNNKYIDSVIEDTYEMIINRRNENDNNNIDLYINEINRLLTSYNFNFNNNKDRFEILKKFLDILNSFRKKQDKESQNKKSQKYVNIAYMGGKKKSK